MNAPPDPGLADVADVVLGGRYQLGAPLGRGGIGHVYLARRLDTGVEVAVKLLRHEIADSPEMLARFEKEAQAVARLTHPGIVKVIDFGSDAMGAYLVMELVVGQTLRQWLDGDGERVPSRLEILRMFLAIGRGLAAAHELGIVHRDFKPDNVLVADGRVRVTDFGLARPLDLPAHDGPSPVAAALDVSLAATRPGALVGTPAYMSPEQLRGDPADARSDQFSFCVALFEAFYRGTVSVVAPIVATESLFGVLFSALFLRTSERVGPRVAVGAALVVAGGALIAVSR